MSGKPRYVHSFVDRAGRAHNYLRRNGRRIRLDGAPGTEAFQLSYLAALKALESKPRPRLLFERGAITAVNKAASRASSRGWACSINADWMLDQIEQQHYRCALSGIRFRPTMAADKDWLKNPYAPSLDRIDTSKGYDPDNLRVVLLAVNFALNEWGEDILREIAAGLLGNCPRRGGAEE